MRAVINAIISCGIFIYFNYRRVLQMSQIKVENLTFNYEGTSDNIFKNVNFKIDTDWKLGFIRKKRKR